MSNREVIDSYFTAMRRGAQAEEDLISLFAEEATYSEPFSGHPSANGLEEIRQRLRLGWEQPLPDLELDVLEIEVDGRNARARWECRSPALPRPMQGEDSYEIVNGQITRLEVRLL